MCDQIMERPITVTSDKPSFTLRGLLPHSKYRISVAAKTDIAGNTSYPFDFNFLKAA